MDQKWFDVTRCGVSIPKPYGPTFKMEQFEFGSLTVIATSDHILPSQCNHSDESSSFFTNECKLCEYNKELEIPQLPEMVFPWNSLTILMTDCPEVKLSFNALDALREVDCTSFSDIMVEPSTVWQESRKDLTTLHPFGPPFDWTFSSEYTGTVQGLDVTSQTLQIELTDEQISMDKLRRRDPINFYAHLTLYEDELADHGTSQMSLRIRVMPSCLFLLCRFYLRVDHVFVRICDTRVYSELGSNYLLREWSKKEMRLSGASENVKKYMFDPNNLWEYLPLVKKETHKLTFTE